jgi:hypothetical protein
MYGGIGLVAPKRVGRYMVERIGSRDRSRGGMVGRGLEGNPLRMLRIRWCSCNDVM